MKEAAGEANMTVVTIILIAAVVAVATPIVTSTLGNSARRGCCSSAGGLWVNNNCTGDGTNGAFNETEYNQCVGQTGQNT